MYNNSSIILNYTQQQQESDIFQYGLWSKVLFSFFIFPIIFFSITGNTLVIIAIAKTDSLRKISNTFLASLAVADCAVGILAMTPNAIQLLSGKWFFKSFFCKFWFASDVLFSTASILHLCCISIDRYLSVSDKYAFSYNAEDASSWRIRLMIGGCWVTSALLSFIPIFTGIYTTQEQLNIIHSLDYTNGHCAFKVNLWYRFLSSFISFWIPCVALVIFYTLLIKKAYLIEQSLQRNGSLSFRRKRELRDSVSNEGEFDSRSSKIFNKKKKFSQCEPTKLTESVSNIGGYNSKRDSSITSLKIWKSEFRLIRTLGFVISVFVLCWFFFFLRYTLCGTTYNLCSDFLANNLVLEDVLFWIGYFNSMVNPFLYNFTNEEFRKAFKSLWFGGRNFRSESNASYPSRKTTIDDVNQAQNLLAQDTHNRSKMYLI